MRSIGFDDRSDDSEALEKKEISMTSRSGPKEWTKGSTIR